MLSCGFLCWDSLGSGSGGSVKLLLSPLGLCKMRVLLRDRQMVMNEDNDTCRPSAEYQGQFFSGDRYSPSLSSISHYVAP